MLAAAVAGSAVLGAYSAKKASDKVSDSADKATELQAKIYKETTKNFKPYLDAGKRAINPLLWEMGLLGRGKEKNRPKGYGGYEASPMFRYALETGVEQIEGSAASYSGPNNGATMEALEAKRRQLTSADTGTYFDRMFNLMGTGQNAAAQQGAFGADYANNASQTMMASGQAQADGIMDATNAITGGIGDMAALYGYNNPMQQYSQSYGSSAGSPLSATPWLSNWARGSG